MSAAETKNEDNKDDDDDDNDKIISAETSKRICTHMNDDHAVSVYAMAKSMLGSSSSCGKITDATLKEVSLDGCNIAVVTCRGDRCEMKRLIYPFRPRLTSGSEVRPRMVAIHQQVCAPRISWLVADGLALSVLVVVGSLGYATHVVGTEELTSQIEAFDWLNSATSLFFGSAGTFSRWVRYSWFLALFLHDLEAFYVLYHARQTLKLHANSQILWYVMVCMVGYPVTSKMLDLLRVHRANNQAKNKKGD